MLGSGLVPNYISIFDPLLFFVLVMVVVGGYQFSENIKTSEMCTAAQKKGGPNRKPTFSDLTCQLHRISNAPYEKYFTSKTTEQDCKIATNHIFVTDQKVVKMW